jgi:two-component system, OmpR family, heavy metal sensor histidine kinase CusS
MLSVPRAREMFSTLRFRLVLWITLVVFLMVVGTNIAVRELEQRALQQSYDQFLVDSMEDVQLTVARFDPEGQLDREKLEDRVAAYYHRSWFLQLFDKDKHPIFTSKNAPLLAPLSFAGDVNGPFNKNEHRVLEKKLRKPSGEPYYVRCGFNQTELQEDIDVLNRSILVASISILLAAPLGAYIIALRATRPIAQIIATTALLQPSNLNERLPIRGTRDEIDQLSQTINSMLDRLVSFIDQNRDFVANAAHELRSPLAAIRSSVEVALNRSRSPEEYTAILSDVMEEIARLAGLVNRLLILAEGDAGRLGAADQATRLDKIVRESVDMFEAVAESKGVRLTAGDIAPALVPGDETHLRQVVRNLIDNAIKYNRNPGEVVVHLRVESAKKLAFLTVTDTGIGIDRDVLPRIFERFYRADRARTREQERAGSGLGLSICQTIIQALRGEIAVTSEAGRGSTFTVQLPLLGSQGSGVSEAVASL